MGHVMHRLTSEILKLYSDTPAAEIAAMYNKSVSHIYKTAYRYGVKKSEDFMNSSKSGRIRNGQHLSPETELKKGHSLNKGKKREQYMSPEGIAHQHRWRKGNKPHTTLFDGAITTRLVSGEYKYKFIRIAEGEWVFLHRYIWEQEHGGIPDDYNVVFKDGNPLNCVLENLECISNAELGERNRIGKYPKELQTAIKLKNKIIKKVKSYGKKQNHGFE